MNDGICGFQWPDNFHGVRFSHICYRDKGHTEACECYCSQSCLGVNYQKEIIQP